MSNYDPRSISQMYEQYGRTHGGSSGSGSTYDEVPQTLTKGLGTPLNQSFNTGSDDDDDKPNETKSFFENVFSWFNASGAEPRKPERYDGSSLYSRDEFKPIKYDPSTNTTSVTGYDPGTPMRSGDDIMSDVDAMLDRSDDAGYTPDPALGSTYDEVKDQNRPPVTIEDAINTAIENTIPTEGYKVQRGDTLSEIAAATGRTVEELKQLNNITDPRKMQAGSTLRIPVQTAQDKEIVAGATKMSDLKPLRTANQSMMTGDQRDYAPEDLSGFSGMGPDPSEGQPIIKGLMSKADDDMGLPYTRSDAEKEIALEPMFKFIEKGEGGYNASNRGTLEGKGIQGGTNNTTRDGKKLTEMTIAEIKAKQSITDPNNKDRLFAVGRFQTIPTTLDMAINALNLSDDTVFNESTQNKIGMYLITQKRPKVGKYIQGDNSVSQDEAMLELAKEFASFPVPKDMTIKRGGKTVKIKKGDSYYGSGNKAKHTFEEVEEELDKLRGNM